MFFFFDKKKSRLFMSRFDGDRVSLISSLQMSISNLFTGIVLRCILMAFPNLIRDCIKCNFGRPF